MISNEDWVESWSKGRIGFHIKKINIWLEKHAADRLFEGQSNCKVFVPLCGKSVDIRWFAELGHSVVGVDVSKLAITSFYEEQGIEYVEEPVPQIPAATVYKSKDSKISLYEADLFSLTKDVIGQFDCIWDRASLVAINRMDRQKYVSTLTSLLAPNFRYLLSVLDYDPTKGEGPPFNVPNSVVEELFGSVCRIEKIDAAKADPSPFPADVDCVETLLLMKPK